MLLEIASCTILFTSASLTLPYVIPYFRNKLQQIKAVPNAVFDTACIHDIHQSHVDAIDRSIGQLLASIGQIIITGWAILNILGLHAYYSLDAFFIGYYIYDTIQLLTKPYGKTLRLFHVHHVLTVSLATYIHMLDMSLYYYMYLNIIYGLLEISGAAINITNLLIHIYPSSKYIIPCSFMNLSIYFITRIVVFPILILYAAQDMYRTANNMYTFSLYLPIIGLGTMLFIACTYWFIGMVAKHKALKQKLIL